jgi:putative inorganic carbon (hco3(-)) transporter
MPPDVPAAVSWLANRSDVEAPGARAAEWWRPDRHGPPAGERAPAAGESQSSPAPFWALMGLTGVMLFSPQNYVPALAPFRPALLTAGAGIAAYAFDRWSRGKPLVEWTRPMKLVVALILWAAATVPLSIWPGGSVAVVMDAYLKAVVMFWLLSEVIGTKERLRQAAWLLTAMALGLGLFAVYNYATGEVFQSSAQERVLGNMASLTRNPNDLALMINLLVPLTVALFLGERHGLKRNLLLAAIGIEVSTVGLTYSRAGALTLAVIVLLYLWKLRGRPERSWLFGLVVALLLALPLAPASYFERLSTIASVDADRTGSSQERWSDMVIATKIVAANPVVGAGIGMNPLAMREARGTGWAPVHNVYLEHAVDLGLPGLALFLLLLHSCLTLSRAAQRRYAELGWGRTRLLGEGLEISLIAYAVAAMFHPVSYHPYFYYMAGLALASWKIARDCANAEVPA